MMPGVSPHEWLEPKLLALVAEAEGQGIARDVCVAVITDLINGPEYSPAVIEDNENWNQDIGEPDYMVNQDGTASDGGGEGGPLGGLDHLEHFPIRHRGRRI